MSSDIINGQHDPLFGDVSREAYIAQMREIALFAGRSELAGEPILTHNSWRHEDVATGLSFDNLAGGRRAEVSATTLFRVHELAYTSEDESAEVVRATLKRFSGSGDNYQFSAALDKAEGELRVDLLDTLVDHEIMIGYPTGAIRWIKRAGGNKIGTEAHGYDLSFFEKVWELSQHDDIGVRERAELATVIVDQSADIISEESWETEEGKAASTVWMERFVKAEQEVDDALLFKAQDLITYAVQPGEHTLHMLANDLETRILDRWRWHNHADNEAYANAKVKNMVEANLQLRFLDALTSIEMAETTNTGGNVQIGDINSAHVTLMMFEELVEKDPDVYDFHNRSIPNWIATDTLPEETLTSYREQLENFKRRIAVFEGTSEITGHNRQGKLQRLANFLLRRS